MSSYYVTCQVNYLQTWVHLVVMESGPVYPEDRVRDVKSSLGDVKRRERNFKSQRTVTDFGLGNRVVWYDVNGTEISASESPNSDDGALVTTVVQPERNRVLPRVHLYPGPDTKRSVRLRDL